MMAAFLVPALLSLSAWASLGMPTDRGALGTLVASVLGNIAGAIVVYAKEIGGGAPLASTANSNTTTSNPAKTQLLIRSFPSKFKFFLAAFAHDTIGMAGRHGRYDPDPGRRKRHRGHRKGVEPAGLKRWRLAHRRTHDPGYAQSYRTGRRGGHYFLGPKKRRYDPARRAPSRRFGRVRHYGSKAEGMINRYGTWIGGALALFAGIWDSVSQYEKAYPGKGLENWFNQTTGQGGRAIEVGHLANFNMSDQWNVLNYLKYKFLGTNPDGTTGHSSWMLPFWAGLITWIGTSVFKRFRPGRASRIITPINKIAKGLTIVSAIGALALPGSGQTGPGANRATVNMVQTQPGQFAPAPQNAQYASAY